MKKVIIIILSIIPLLGFSQTLEQKLIKPQKLYVGTPFHVLVDISTVQTDSIFATPIDTLDVFILRDMKSEDMLEDDTRTTKLDLTFQPFDTGEFTFPELEFAVVSENDTTFLKTNEFLLIIESVLSDSSDVVMDIADPLKVNLGFWDYFFPILAIIIIVLAIIFISKALRNRDLNIEKPVYVDSRPPYQIVLELLSKLNKENLPAKGEFLRFHFRLSYLLRLFIELHYKITAVEMTTNEIRSDLQLEDFKEKSQIVDFLSFADKIKFAKFQPTVDESNKAESWLQDYLKSFKEKSIETETEKSEMNQEETNA
jgi:hypothetical protein